MKETYTRYMNNVHYCHILKALTDNENIFIMCQIDNIHLQQVLLYKLTFTISYFIICFYCYYPRLWKITLEKGRGQ